MAGILSLSGRACFRQLTTLRLFGSHAGLIEVCIVDPREVLQNPKPRGASVSPGNKENSQPALAGAIRLKVPNSFLTELSRGVFELGDADEPMNHWRFGKPADIFELDYVGKCSIASGIVGVIGAKELLDMSSAESWQHLQELVDNASDTFPAAKSSFMFAGRVVQSDTVSIYTYKEGGEIKGLQISSDAEELD